MFAVLAASGCRLKRNLAVGSKNFTEQVILGEITAQQIERRLDRKVDRTLNLGGTMVVHAAMIDGAIDVYPEYTSTALYAVLKINMLATSPKEVYERVKEVYAQNFRFDVLPPLGFNNSFVIGVYQPLADKHKLQTITDAEKVHDTWVLGVGYEFEQRPDGLPALEAKYDIPTRGAPITMDLGLLYKALEQRQVNMIAGNTTDAQIASSPVKLLKDDRSAFGPYEAVLILNRQVAADTPGLKEALLELSGKISEDQMRRMNYEVDVKRARVSDVAAAFLRTIKQ
ncbi:MAG TPA: glycine betaine ABC transporter substrate-binding protein [Bryobacteraceae bacterium]|jgi:glycine betaine/choline ABC-type transport system substrate-binding protein|nr:glycine betaine ABC transporter substrate-binding protein [Bryobacteraceae bacterium]